MKRISIAVGALGLSTGSFAAIPAGTNPNLVTIPQLPGGIVMGGSAVLLQPSTSNGDLDYAIVNNGDGDNYGSTLKNVNPGYNWGWGVNIGYIFPNTGNDINLSYLQLDTSNTNSVYGNNVNGISAFGNTVEFASFQNVFAQSPTGIIESAMAKARYNLNQVDLTVGQYINVGCRLNLHPYAGLRWAQIERKLDTVYSQHLTGSDTAVLPVPTLILNQAVSYEEKSDFEGIGPVTGLDASYYVGLGFGVVGHFDGALLVGNTSTSTVSELAQEQAEITDLIPFTVRGNQIANFSIPDSRRVVPVLDGKLGVDYTYMFNNSANSNLTLEAGWMVSEYFNAIDRLSTDTTVSFNRGSMATPASFSANAALTGHSTANISLQGPYVSLTLHL